MSPSRSRTPQGHPPESCALIAESANALQKCETNHDMTTLKLALIAELTQISGFEARPSPVAGGTALFYRDKEFAHFHHDQELDLRLTRQGIKSLGLVHPPHSAQHPTRWLRRSGSRFSSTSKKTFAGQFNWSGPPSSNFEGAEHGAILTIPSQAVKPRKSPSRVRSRVPNGTECGNAASFHPVDHLPGHLAVRDADHGFGVVLAVCRVDKPEHAWLAEFIGVPDQRAGLH